MLVYNNIKFFNQRLRILPQQSNVKHSVSLTTDQRFSKITILQVCDQPAGCWARARGPELRAGSAGAAVPGGGGALHRAAVRGQDHSLQVGGQYSTVQYSTVQPCTAPLCEARTTACK